MDMIYPNQRAFKELCKCVPGLTCSYCKWLLLSAVSEEESKDYQIESLKEEVKSLKKEIVKLKNKTVKYCKDCGKVKMLTPAEVRTGLCRDCRECDMGDMERYRDIRL